MIPWECVDMMNDSGKLTCTQRIIRGCALIVILLVSGCGDFFEKKTVEVQTREILRELREVKESPHIKNPLPEMYRGPAKRIKVKEDRNKVESFIDKSSNIWTIAADLDVNRLFVIQYEDYGEGDVTVSADIFSYENLSIPIFSCMEYGEAQIAMSSP